MVKRKHLKIKAIQHFSIMVCQLTLEKWEYHQCLIELQLYPAESFTGGKSFDSSEENGRKFFASSRARAATN